MTVHSWRSAFTCFTILVTLTSCSTKEKQSEVPDVFANLMDTTVNAGEDFFQYAHGTWIKNNPIPASESSWGIHREVLNEVYDRLKKICEEAAQNPGDLKSTQMVGTLWATGMDSLAIENKKLSDLQPYLDQLTNIKSKQELFAAVATLRTMGAQPLFQTYVAQDDKNSEQYAFFLHQGGLGLPDRDYYFNSDERSVNIRKEYVMHMTKMFSLLGRDGASAEAVSKTLMNLETSLAKASRKLEDLRDPYKNYNKYATADLPKKFKGIEWSMLLNGMNIKVDSIIVGQPEFISAVERLLGTESLQTWKDYLTWNLITKYSPLLSLDFRNENFHFFDLVLKGRKEQRPRWKRMLLVEEDYIGDLLGQEFVKNYFPPETKRRYIKIVDEVIVAFREHIQNLEWMTDSTKQKALVKLSTIRKKIGYPDKWKDYSTLEFSKDSFLKNCIAGEKWLYEYDNKKLGKPVDRDEWFMTPQTYNAYYNPANNEIVLPATILMIPGLNDEDTDDAVVYGYVAASTVGHELVHAFDDQGSQYDEKGNLRNWWTKKDKEQFDKKVMAIVNQFNQYRMLDSLKVNGEATAGENIADLGGIVIALDAFEKTQQYKDGKMIGGLTPLQRYFLGYAMGWKVVDTDESILMTVTSDVHAPATLRVNGPFSNVPEFYESFDVKEGQRMWRPDSSRVRIW